ncbi:DsbA family oxidoreductase [Falsirhodobacter sp. 20TX0035]|uniref:DsbA family oxidoreductase n=1 Tax=Falsirhodobacter sp. 20TX0035 TaxID=3022019 RepID=UPI00232C8630|nr:DsbA family oxidoreductase [Falsirhodobacter sp. 20TX0035]MDB6453429.1 DsbA family oxidoreductase [Falsirhodobacter sp. 20TX0035]
MTPATIPLDVFSDPVCPWCFIGKTFLDRALESRPLHPFRVDWHPFRLNTDLPPEGVERAPYLEAKFGDRRSVAEAMARIQEVADKAGVRMDLGRANRIPDTLDAHRLIHWAGIEGAQNRVVDALFRAYFQDGADIGQASVLSDIAAACGMDGALVGRLLSTDADRDDLMARDLDAREKGVTAVPTFLVDRQFVLAGAQSTDTWQQIIDDILRQLETT